MTWSTAQMDPPWMEQGAGKIKRGADRHYPLLKTKDMPGIIVGSGLWMPAENAHLYLWSTNVFLPDAIWLMKELGFVYKTNVVWTKTRIGIGRYFRGKHELLLFGTRGRGWDVRTAPNDIPSEIETDAEKYELYFEGSAVRADHETVNGKRKHSAKPKVFYDMIESRSKGPYIEFFARSRRPGWASWGNDEAVAPKAPLAEERPPPPGGYGQTPPADPDCSLDLLEPYPPRCPNEGCQSPACQAMNRCLALEPIPDDDLV